MVNKRSSEYTIQKLQKQYRVQRRDREKYIGHIGTVANCGRRKTNDYTDYMAPG